MLGLDKEEKEKGQDIEINNTWFYSQWIHKLMRISCFSWKTEVMAIYCSLQCEQSMILSFLRKTWKSNTRMTEGLLTTSCLPSVRRTCPGTVCRICSFVRTSRYITGSLLLMLFSSSDSKLGVNYLALMLYSIKQVQNVLNSYLYFNYILLSN